MIDRLLEHPDLAAAASHTAEAMLVAERTLCAHIVPEGQAAHVVLGIMRFSLLRLRQTTLDGLLDAGCSVVIYGQEDERIAPRRGLTLMPLASNSPLNTQWFTLARTPRFAAALIGVVRRDPLDTTGRRVAVCGGLTHQPSIVARALLLLHLNAGLPRPTGMPEDRDPGLQHELTTALLQHPHSERLQLPTMVLDRSAPPQSSALQDADRLLLGLMPADAPTAPMNRSHWSGSYT
jgi:hypothetical protein